MGGALRRRGPPAGGDGAKCPRFWAGDFGSWEVAPLTGGAVRRSVPLQRGVAGVKLGMYSVSLLSRGWPPSGARPSGLCGRAGCSARGADQMLLHYLCTLGPMLRANAMRTSAAYVVEANGGDAVMVATAVYGLGTNTA